MDATFWATVALLIFLAIVIYYKVPGMIAGQLDQRAAKIQNELDEARRLREEAQQLLADYQRKRKEAEAEAQGIVDAAKREAKALAADAKVKTEEYVARRTAFAEQKIARPNVMRLPKCAAALSRSQSRRPARCWATRSMRRLPENCSSSRLMR
jgi:F-type H+-transporting ATPase subunit b